MATASQKGSYLLLLLMDMTNLEPDIGLCQRARWCVQDVAEALDPNVN